MMGQPGAGVRGRKVLWGNWDQSDQTITGSGYTVKFLHEMITKEVKQIGKPPSKFFLVARPLRRPSSLVATFFLEFFWESFKKSYFFLVARPLPLPPLRGRVTKKRTFFAASLNQASVSLC